MPQYKRLNKSFLGSVTSAYVLDVLGYQKIMINHSVYNQDFYVKTHDRFGNPQVFMADHVESRFARVFHKPVITKSFKGLNSQNSYTANVCRDLQGFCREIGVQGFQIYRDCMYTRKPCNF